MSTLQVGISPDTEESRDKVSSCLGWVFSQTETEGVWLVETPVDWPEDMEMDLTLSSPELENVSIRVTVEWP
jgi:hypothetical protein